MVLETWNGGRPRPLCARHVLAAPRVGRGHVLARGRQRGGALRYRFHPCLVRLRGLARARPRAHCPALRHPHPRYHPAAHRWRIPTGAHTGRSASGGLGVAGGPRRECGHRGGTLRLAPPLADLAPVLPAHHGRWSVPRATAALERFLAVFNLLPAFPMDGGRVLRAVLAMRMDYVRATQVSAQVGQAMALGFGLLGLFTNPFLVFIAFFVWIGAAQEASMVQMRTALSGVPVSRAMLTHFQSVAPDDAAKRVLELIVAGSQQDFPVVDGGQDRKSGV